MKRMIRTINASVWICSKACNKTVYKKHCTLFYGTFCGPASVFHEAVSICHTWLSNNPVVGQTKQNPGDITLKTFLLVNSPLQCLSPPLSLNPFFSSFPFQYWASVYYRLNSLQSCLFIHHPPLYAPSLSIYPAILSSRPP